MHAFSHAHHWSIECVDELLFNNVPNVSELLQNISLLSKSNDRNAAQRNY